MNVVKDTKFHPSIKPFVVESGALRVTDPCYQPDTWCSGQLDNVLNGNWKAAVGLWQCPSDLNKFNHWINEGQKQVDQANAEIEKARAEGASEDEILSKVFFRDFMKRERVDDMQKHKDEYKGRISVLAVAHESVDEEWLKSFSTNGMVLSSIHVGVDSGQAGFYDLKAFTEVKKYEDHAEAFYRGVCDATLGDEQFGTNQFGATSSSGYGDGGYDCFYKTNDAGQIVAAMIIFIAEDEDEDFDEDEAGLSDHELAN
jgi:Protein of unknown function (DUF4241)